MPTTCRVRVLTLILVLTGTSLGIAGDWAHWRGPHRNDISDESSGWKGDDWKPEKVWTAHVGEGSSSPVVVGNRLFCLGWQDGKEIVFCLNAETGHEVWKSGYEALRYGRYARGDEGLYSGPCSTPEFDSETGYLYSLGSDGDLHCLDTNKNGEVVWKKNLYDEYHAPVRPRVGRSGHRDYGYTSSPLIHEGSLIVEVGAPTGNLMGFDKRTGAQLWTSVVKCSAGHNGGPVPLTVAGVPCVAVHNFEGLLVVRLDSGHIGRTVAQVPWVTDFANNIATATVLDDNVVMTSGYNQHKIARYRISLDKGAELVWDAPISSRVCSPVIVNGHVYWAWEQIYCVDFETGEIRWQGGRTGDAGSLVATSDNRLILWSGRGELSLIEQRERSPDSLTVLMKREVFQRSDAWPHIVLSNGHLYCKDRTGEIACFH